MSCNLCAFMRGKSNRVIVVGAHLDSVPGSVGANDNGVGAIGVLEIAGIISRSKTELKHSVLFCFFGKEETVKALGWGRSDLLSFGSAVFLRNDHYKQAIQTLADSTDDFSLMCYLNFEIIGTKPENKAFPDYEVVVQDPRIDAHELNKQIPVTQQEFSEVFGRIEKPTTLKKNQQLADLFADYYQRHNVTVLKMPQLPVYSDDGFVPVL